MHKDDLEQRIVGLQSAPGFHVPRIWLTFYIAGVIEPVQRFADALRKLHEIKFCDAENGVMHPKLPVSNSVADIMALVRQVQDLATAHGVDLTAVDADTMACPVSSQFGQIIYYEGHDGAGRQRYR